MRRNKHSLELCSRTVKAGHRVYFVDAKVDSQGNRFVAISEVISQQGTERRERQRIHIYEQDMPKFLDAMGDALTALAEERRAQQEGSPVDSIQPETAEALGLGSPAQVNIPELDEIIGEQEKEGQGDV